MTTTLANIIEAYKSIGTDSYILTVDEEYVTATLQKVSSRSKYGYVQIWAYRFKTLDALEQYAQKDLDYRLQKVIDEKNRKVERLAKLNQDIQSVNVGDLFNSSWGYEQTNQEFFVIVGKPTKTTALVQRVGYTSINETSWCSEDVKIDVDNKIGEPFKVKLTGKSFKTSSFSSAYKFEDKNRTFYRSWGY